MKSRWHRGPVEGQHAPVEMRFVDMFMTALGSLIFIVLLLVFLLPKTARPVESKDQPPQRLGGENNEVDKHVSKRWIGVLLFTEGCHAYDPLLYVRWDGPLINFDTRAPTESMPEFDAGDLKFDRLVGHRSFRIASINETKMSFPYSTVTSELLKGERVHVMLHYGVSTGVGPWDVYVALSDARGFAGKQCIVHPTILFSEGTLEGEKIVLALHQPYAWLRRINVKRGGEVQSPNPRGDDAFLRNLDEFSEKQNRLLCEKKFICDTQDAHWAVLRPTAPAQNTAFEWKLEWKKEAVFKGRGYSYKTGDSSSECEKSCLESERCAGVEYDEYYRFCVLHDRAESIEPFPNPKRRVGLKRGASPLQWQRDHLVGGDRPSGNRDGISRDECAKACAEDAKCAAVQYVKPTRSCNIFNSPPKIVPSPLGSNSPHDVGIKVRSMLDIPLKRRRQLQRDYRKETGKNPETDAGEETADFKAWMAKRAD